MAEPGESENGPRCSEPECNGAITAYCFGGIREEDRDRFEAHVLECDLCWQEVQRLDSLIHTLRSEKSLTQRHFVSDIVSLVGISSEFPRFVAGHRIHAAVAAAIFACTVAGSVLMEIAYQCDRFGLFAWTAAPVAFLWMAGAIVTALVADWKLTGSGRTSGLAASIVVLLSAAALQYLVLRPSLPAYPITEATFQTWTAQAAYLKDTVYTVAFAALFTLLPFHFIVTMQRELQGGRHRMAFELLTGGRFAVAPLRSPYIRPWLLVVLLLGGAIYSILSTAHLLEALKVTEYSNLFILTIQIRWLLFLALGLEGLAWYHSSLNELKRESGAVYRLSSPHLTSR